MFFKKISELAAISGLVAGVAFPAFVMCVIFYYMFSDQSKKMFLDTIILTVNGSESVALTVNPSFLILVAIIFAVTFLIGLPFFYLKRKS